MSVIRTTSRFAIALLFPLVTFLTACTHKSNMDNADAGSFQNTAACKSNAFLQRYGCSLDRVEQAAESNDPDAMYALGYMYYYGVGTVKDPDTAIVWIRRAAGQNQPLAIQAMNIIRKKQFKRQGQTTVDRSAQLASSIPNTKPKPSQLKTYHQQFTQAKPKAQPKAVQVAKKTTPFAAAKPVVAKGASSNWAGANAPTDHVVASHTADTIAAKEKKHYTLQIMAAHHLDIIKQFLSSHQLGPQASYYHTYFQNKNWYVLIYGDYASVTQAKQAVHHLPKSVQRMHPWVKSYRTVQKEILQKRVI